MSLFNEHLESQTKLARRSRSLDYNQFKEMQLIRSVGRSRRWIPQFAANDVQVRAVIIHVTLGYIFRTGIIPPDIATDLAHLKELASIRQAWAESLCQTRLEQHLVAVRGCGGYMEMLGAIAYRAWRLCWHDRDIAASLAMTPTAVLSVRTRLLRCAERLGFSTYPRKRKVRFDDGLVASMWRNGATVSLISAILGCDNRLVRHSLRKQGLYAKRPRNRRGIDFEERLAKWRRNSRARRERQRSRNAE